MTIRQQYANEELVHKLRSMLNDLPTLRTRAVKKLKHWREAAIKRLLVRQRELEKTLLDKFERLEFDTQLFVEKVERKKANQQRRWQSEPLDYQNKTEIDRISTNLRSIREELEQSKLILAGTTIDDDEMNELLSNDLTPAKLAGTSRQSGTLSSKTPVQKNQETDDFGSELKRVLEICTSPQRSSSSLSADELTPLQSLDHAEYCYDAKSKQTTAKTTKSIQPKQGSQTVGTQRRNTRTVSNVPIQQQQQQQQQNGSTNTNGQNGGNNNNSNNHKSFAFESFDDSIRRFQRLREIRKNLRTKYDDQPQQPSVEAVPPSSTITNEKTETVSDNRSVTQQKSTNTSNRSVSNGTHTVPPVPLTIKSTVNATNTPPRKNGEARRTLLSRESVSIPIERVATVTNPLPKPDPDVLELYDKAANSVHGAKETINAKDRRHRSRTLEVHQIQAVDNQIYGCPSASKTKQQTQHRSESHKQRTNRISVRRSSEDTQDKQSKIRKNNEHHTNNENSETWLEIGQEHWVNLLENGWRPTVGTSGITCVAINDADSRGRKQAKSNVKAIDLYEQISKDDYTLLFEQLEFAYARTINLGNEFWRFLEISGNQQLCLYHQLNKQFIMYKPDVSLLCFPWSYDGIIDISWSKTTNTWIVATQTQIIICNRSFSKIHRSIDINGDWPKRITSCQSSIFHTYKIPSAPTTTPPLTSPSFQQSPNKDRPQFLLERYDYNLKSSVKHILESSTIWDIEADDSTENLAVLCDVALLLFDYQLNLLKQIEVTGFKVSRDHFGGWLIADYNASCIWQIKRNEYTKPNKILHVERPWSVILDQTTWTLITLSETQNRAKRLLFFNMKNIPVSISANNSAQSQSQLSISPSSSVSNLST